MAKTTNNHKQNFTPLDTKPQTGFTIIEVVLVLAIAGLIFLIVFLALPGLQKSRRDTQRKSDADRMIAAIISYQSNSGSFPAPNFGSSTKFVPFTAQSCSLGGCVIQTPDKFTDPSTDSAYGQMGSQGENGLALPKLGDVMYIPNYMCGTNSAIVDSSWLHYMNSKTGVAALVMPLESGGYYCRDTGA